MTRNLRTFFLVAALSIPSFSAPVQANDDFKKLLAALAVMGVIGVVAERERDKPIVAPVAPIPQPQRRPNRRWEDKSKRLPQKCFKTYPTEDGRLSFFSKKCLKKKYKSARNLPQKCERSVRTKGKTRSLYSPNCLQRNGYSSFRHRH